MNSSQGHILHTMDEALQSLQSQALEMGKDIERQFENIHAAIDGKPTMSQDFKHLEHKINKHELQLLAGCMEFLARYSPVGRDLRYVTRLIRQTVDFERMGDELQHVGEGLLYLQEILPKLHDWRQSFSALLEACEGASAKMLKVMRTEDPKAATKLASKDRHIDALQLEADERAMELLVQKTVTEEEFLQLHRLARSLERFGDHIKNVCEELTFVVTGRSLDSGKEEKGQDSA